MGNVIFSELQFHQLQQVVYCSNIVGKGDLKNINIGEKQKASHSKNDLLNGGGEGEILLPTRNHSRVLDMHLKCFLISPFSCSLNLPQAALTLKARAFGTRVRIAFD